MSDYSNSHMTQSTKHIDLTHQTNATHEFTQNADNDLEQARKKQKSTNEELNRVHFGTNQRTNFDAVTNFHAMQPNYQSQSHNMNFQQTFQPVLSTNTQVSQSAANPPNYVMSNTSAPSSQPILPPSGTTYPEPNINIGYQRTYGLEQPYASPPVPQFHPSQTSATSSYAPFVSVPPPMPNTHLPPLYHNPNHVTTGYPVTVPQEQFISQTTYFPQMQPQTNAIPWNVPHANAPASFSNYPPSAMHPKPPESTPPPQQKKVVLSSSAKPVEHKRDQPKTSPSPTPSSASQSQTIPRDNNALRTETFSAKLKPSGFEVSAILEGAPSVGFLVEFNIRGQTYKGFLLNSSLYKSPVDFMPKDFQYQQMLQHQQQMQQQNGNEARNTISLKELEGAEKVVDVGRSIITADVSKNSNPQPTSSPKEQVTPKDLPALVKEQPKENQAPQQVQSPKETKSSGFKWQCYLCSEASPSSIELTEHIKKVHGSQPVSPNPENVKKLEQ